MKQKILRLKLRDYTVRDDVHGNREGRAVYSALLQDIDNHQDFNLVEISLAGISRTDASFPRESVVSIAKQFRGDKGIYLTGISAENRDLLDNWHYAALAKKQPITVWFSNDYQTLGPELSASMTEILSYVLTQSEITAANISTKFDITVPNASSKLKKLANDGYILRIERVASSGGMEFVYCPIK